MAARITAFVGEKGGGSKSTTCQNMAVQLTKGGKKVIVGDADPQGTTTKWGDRRVDASIEPRVEVRQVSAKNLTAFLEKNSEEYDHILIDTGGADSSEMRVALLFADDAVCPCEPSQADVETLEHVNDVIRKHLPENPSLKACIVATKASSHASSTEVEELRDTSKHFENMTLLNTVIYSRKAFKDALRDGLGVVELPINDFSRKAIAESTQLEKELFHGND